MHLCSAGPRPLRQSPRRLARRTGRDAVPRAAGSEVRPVANLDVRRHPSSRRRRAASREQLLDHNCSLACHGRHLDSTSACGSDDRTHATYGHISTWETGVTDMSWLFCAVGEWQSASFGAASLQRGAQPSGVTTMEGMFYSPRPLTRTSARGTPPDDVLMFRPRTRTSVVGRSRASVTDMRCLFTYASGWADQDLGCRRERRRELVRGRRRETREAFDGPRARDVVRRRTSRSSVADCPASPNPIMSPTPRPTPAPTPATSDAVEGSFTCAGITLADAEAHAPVYAAAVADVYNVDESKVTFSSPRTDDASLCPPETSS